MVLDWGTTMCLQVSLSEAESGQEEALRHLLQMTAHLFLPNMSADCQHLVSAGYHLAQYLIEMRAKAAGQAVEQAQVALLVQTGPPAVPNWPGLAAALLCQALEPL